MWTLKCTADGGGDVTVCWNYCFRVFKATGTQAVLKMSDWAEPGAPGGDVGNEVVWDFIQVQPFYAEVN